MILDPTPPEPPRRRVPVLIVVLGIFVLFLGGMVVVLQLKPPQKALCSGPAPDVKLTLFSDYRGNWPSDTISLAEARAQKMPVVLNYWASWCQPCEEEAAALQATAQKYQGKVLFVGLDYLDQEPAAKAYLQKFKITYPNGPDLASTNASRYQIRGVPETFFINGDGELVGCRKEGPLSTAELESRIAAILPK